MCCSQDRPEISIVVPFLNEEDTLPLLKERFLELTGLPEKREIIFVSDGSSDRSTEIIEDWAAKDDRVKLLVLTRNFGHQFAICAGLDFSEGQFVGIMDADLQDPPEELLKMYREAINGDWDVVYSIRYRRTGGGLKRIAYRAFYSLYSFLAESPVNLDSGDFSVLSRRAVAMMSRLPEKDRFIRGLRSWLGLRETGMRTLRPKRAAGKAQYSWRKLGALAISGVTSFSTKPLKIATLAGFLLCAAALFLAFIYVGLWAFGNLHETVPGFTTLVILLLVLSGLQFLLLGIIGQYVGRMFLEVKGRPTYLVARSVNLPKALGASAEDSET